MSRFKPPRGRWDEVLPNSYHTNAFHLVLNRYVLQQQDGIDDHQDKSATYAPINPIVSLSYGRCALVVIADTLKDKKQRALFYQYPGDAMIMSGHFN